MDHRAMNGWQIFFDYVGTLSDMPSTEFSSFYKELYQDGFTIKVVTGASSSDGIARILTEAGLETQYWPRVRTGASKDRVETWQSLINDIPASKCLVVDDERENIKAAQKAGMRGILFDSYFFRHQSGKLLYTVDHGLSSEITYAGKLDILRDVLVGARQGVLPAPSGDNSVEPTQLQVMYKQRESEFEQLFGIGPRVPTRKRKPRKPRVDGTQPG